MDLKIKIRKALREQYGSFETYLEHEYEDVLTENLIIGDDTKRREWITYNQVILELKHSIKDLIKVKELQYKLTDKNDPNEVCIQVLDEIRTSSPELDRLYWKISNFR